MAPASSPLPKGGDEDHSGLIIASSAATLAVSTIAVTARFYTRAVMLRALAAEDWFVLLAWLHSVGYTVAMVLQAKSALGHHIWTLQPADLISWGRASWITLFFYQLSLTCSKISILLLYMRVLKTYIWIRRAAWVLFAIVVIYSTLYFLSTVTMCIPLEALWDPAVTGTCHRGSLYMWIPIGFHIVTDFLIFALPIPVVVLMSASPRQRIMLLLIFALGFLVCAVSLLRALLIRPLLYSADFSWDFVGVGHWTNVEVNTAIVCACLLATKPLIDLLWRKVRRASGRHAVGTTTLGSGPPTIGSGSIRGSKPPSGGDRGEGEYASDKVVFGVTEAGDFEVSPMNVGQHYAAAVKEITTVRQERLDVDVEKQSRASD